MICDVCGKESAEGQTLELVQLKVIDRNLAVTAAEQARLGYSSRTLYEAIPLQVFICRQCSEQRATHEDQERIVPAAITLGLGAVGLFLVFRRFDAAFGSYVCSGISLLLLLYGLFSLWRWYARRKQIAGYLERSGRSRKLDWDAPEVKAAVHRRVGASDYCSAQAWEAYQRSLQNKTTYDLPIHTARPLDGGGSRPG